MQRRTRGLPVAKYEKSSLTTDTTLSLPPLRRNITSLLTLLFLTLIAGILYIRFDNTFTEESNITTTSCKIEIVDLGFPTALFEYEQRIAKEQSSPWRSNCSSPADIIAERALMTPAERALGDRYRIIHSLVAGIKRHRRHHFISTTALQRALTGFALKRQLRHPYTQVERSSTKIMRSRTNTKVYLIDDSAFQDVLLCTDNLKNDGRESYNHWFKIVPAIMTERVARIRELLSRETNRNDPFSPTAALDLSTSASLPIFFLVDTWSAVPQHRSASGDDTLGHDRLMRLIVELDNVPPSLRATRSAYFVVPYAAQPISSLPNVPSYALTMSQPRRPAGAPIPSLLFFKAGCNRSPWSSMGMHMRAYFIDALATQPSVRVACSSANTNISTPPARYRAEMESSEFCLLLQGDTPSTSRLSEVMLGRCIPVFAGPPWPLLPLLPVVHYEKFAVFFHMQNATPWLTDADVVELQRPDGQWTIEPLTAALVNETLTKGRRDIDDDSKPLAFDVESPLHMLHRLAEIPSHRREQLRSQANPYRRYFEAAPDVGSGESDRGGAILVLDAACDAYRNAKSTLS